MKLIKIYKGIRIVKDETVANHNKKQFVTEQTNVPILGTMTTRHSSVEEAQKYIDTFTA